MKTYISVILVSLFGLVACAAEITNGSDANHVTFLNSDGASMATLTQKANAYCAQYGKKATFRKNDSSLVTIFDCNLPQ
jgi:putative hemolysin